MLAGCRASVDRRVWVVINSFPDIQRRGGKLPSPQGCLAATVTFNYPQPPGAAQVAADFVPREALRPWLETEACCAKERHGRVVLRAVALVLKTWNQRHIETHCPALALPHYNTSLT